MQSVEELLHQIENGDATARTDLYARLYSDIKRVARARLTSSGGVTGLNTTALVHEGFLRIAGLQALSGRSKGQFLAYVGHVLRSVVIDHLRSERAGKRNIGGIMLTLSSADQQPACVSDQVDLIALDRALTEMRVLDARLYELIEILVFTGTGVDEIAALRQVSRRTVERDVVKARALLRTLMDG